MNNILDKDNNIIKKICKICNLLKNKDEFYNNDTRCKECKYIYQKERNESTKQMIKELQNKLDKIQFINNIMIENILKKDTEIQTLREEIYKIKEKDKRIAFSFN